MSLKTFIGRTLIMTLIIYFLLLVLTPLTFSVQILAVLILFSSLMVLTINVLFLLYMKEMEAVLT